MSNVTIELGEYTKENYSYVTWVISQKFIYVVSDSYDYSSNFDEKNFEHLANTVFLKRVKTASIVYYLNIDNSAVEISINTKTKHIAVEILSLSEETAQEILTLIKKSIEPAADALEGRVRVAFWFNHPDGPRMNSRVITVPKWNEIAANYEASTRENLNRLMQFNPTRGGQLILWHGVPGTGKTYALRSLLDAWRDWCTAEYILDPEALFGQSPAYLSSMMISASEERYDSFGDILEDEPSNSDRWKLFILEDTGELLSESAKERTGQGLSRLLNVADGLIGQGLKILILITTNEELAKIHPAVSRPGRCAATIRFESLGPRAIKEWAKFHDVTTPNKSELSLAELYDLISDNALIKNQSTEKNPLGFNFQRGLDFMKEEENGIQSRP
jgi:SpoVK/Ycf46/Vps4 family AAA+-type ATPase